MNIIKYIRLYRAEAPPSSRRSARPTSMPTYFIVFFYVDKLTSH